MPFPVDAAANLALEFALTKLAVGPYVLKYVITPGRKRGIAALDYHIRVRGLP